MHAIGKIRQVLHFPPDAVLHLHHQPVFIVAGCAPLLKCLGRANMSRYPLHEKIKHRLIRPQSSGPAQLVLRALDLLPDFIEALKKLALGSQATSQYRLPDKHLMRLLGTNTSVKNLPPLDNGQAAAQHGLLAIDSPLVFIPCRGMVAISTQVRHHILHPFNIDGSDFARPHPAGLDQLKSQQPFRLLFAKQTRARKNGKLAATGTAIRPFFLIPETKLHRDARHQ